MQASKSLLNWTAAILIFEALLLFLPLYILGHSINWPASLDEPASVNLPLILEEYPSMMSGYGIYLLYSLLFWPLAFLTGSLILNSDSQKWIFHIANGFAVLSTLARVLGIVRWMFAMPLLARSYISPNTSELLKESISIQYEVLNAYAGGVGELLGVNLFAAIWLALINVLIIKNKTIPSWIAVFGFTTAAILTLNLLEMIGFEMGPMITISVSLFHFWMLFLVVVFIKKAR